MKYQGVLTLSVAAACLVFLGPNFAQAKSMVNTSQSSQSTTSSIAGKHEAMRMVAARADLVKQLNARDIRAGQAFKARLSKKVQLKDGTVLPRGTKLVGKVVSDKMGMNGNTSKLALRFTQAELKSGKVIPIKATIVGVYPPTNGYATSYTDNPTPNLWTPQTLQVNEINAIKHVDLHSKIAAKDSGIFVSHKNNKMKFDQGTELALAIAARNNSRNSMNGMQHGMSGMKSMRGGA